jgi:predicted SAM-dependent methyltransferase
VNGDWFANGANRQSPITSRSLINDHHRHLVAFSDFFRRRKEDPEAAEAAAASNAPVHPTKALPRFLSSLSSRPQPNLIDLGPVVGSNVTFFGEQLGCKIFVEDLSKDIDRHVRENKLADLPAFFAQRFPQADNTVDGILCWDVFDFLDKAAAQAVAKQLVRILRPEGALLAFFTTSEPQPGAKPSYTKHVVVDQVSLQHRDYPAARAKGRPLLNRDIQRMFEPLRITEQFLLKTNMREVLFRKPAAAVAADAPAAGATGTAAAGTGPAPAGTGPAPAAPAAQAGSPSGPARAAGAAPAAKPAKPAKS